MKIYMDNELENFHKIVCIQSSHNKDILDDTTTIIDALHAYGYDSEAIEFAFLQKCVDWGYIVQRETNGEKYD